MRDRDQIFAGSARLVKSAERDVTLRRDAFEEGGALKTTLSSQITRVIFESHTPRKLFTLACLSLPLRSCRQGSASFLINDVVEPKDIGSISPTETPAVSKK